MINIANTYSLVSSYIKLFKFKIALFLLLNISKKSRKSRISEFLKFQSRKSKLNI